MKTVEQERDRGYELAEELTHVVGCTIDFQHIETGGGCTALQLGLNDGRYLLITAEDGGEVPGANETTWVGWYKPMQDEAYCLIEFQNADRLIAFADWAPRMFIVGDPMQSRSWERALSVSHATMLVSPSDGDEAV
jgi:hypothetical protein